MHMNSKQNGFTLLEVIVTTVILGMAAVAVLGFFTRAVEGMLLTRNETAAEENIQAALTRITHEVANLDTKRAYSFSSNTITSYYRTDAATTTIVRAGTTITLGGNILLNNVVNAASGFTVTQPTSPYSVTVSISVQVPGLRGATTTKTYSTVINLNTQRFQ